MNSEDTRARSVDTGSEAQVDPRVEEPAEGQVQDPAQKQAETHTERPDDRDGQPVGAAADDEHQGTPEFPEPPEPQSGSGLPDNLATDVKSVSAAREVDGARAWDASDRLARLALLVTGSPDRAYRLTRETLISVGRSGPYVQARRRLLRRAVRTRVDAYSAGLLPGLAGPTPAARLWRRLMTLPAVERALVVLTEAEGMADAVAGAVLGLPRVETEQTLTRVRETLEVHSQLTETERREVFDGPALRPASGLVPTQALARVRRSRRLRRTLTASVTVLALVGGVLLAVTVTRPDPGDEPLRHTEASTGPADPTSWQSRGDLLHDRKLLRAAVGVWQAGNHRGLGDQATGTTRADRTDLPTVLWAGRLDGNRSLVVLAGRDQDGRRVVGSLVDQVGHDGQGLELVGLATSARTLALNLTGLDPDQPGSRRYLVAPGVSAVAVNDPDGQQPVDAQAFRMLGLHNGLSEPWVRQTDSCTLPLLRLANGGTAGGSGPDGSDSSEGMADYVLDVTTDGPTTPVTEPPTDGPARAAYFGAVHGLVTCATSDPTAPSLVPSLASGTAATDTADGTDGPRVLVSGLDVHQVWAGRLPDGAVGQVLRLSWLVADAAATPPVDPAATDGTGSPDPTDSANPANPADPAGVGRFAQVFALVTGESVRYSSVRSGLVEPDHAVDGVAWTSARDHRGYLLLAAGEGSTTVDLAPRPKGFRPGHPVAFVGLPKPGQKLSVVGLDRFNRPVSVQPLDF